MAHFGVDFIWQGRSLTRIEEITEHEVGPTVPLLLCSAPGHDVSGRVESMARELHKELSAVAMGSSEGFDTANTLIASAAKRGTWVLLKNVHLCVNWLRENLVKRLQGLGHSNTHQDFRLFITSEINPLLPTGLLRICDTIVAQAPTGIKASMTRLFSSISKDRFHQPVRNRLYLLLAWTHAVIQELLRFVPNGWTQVYEFTEADASHALDIIDSLLESGDRQALDPEKLPWDAIRATLSRSVFGGRITNSEKDQKTLENLVGSLFKPESFNVDFAVVPHENVVFPESTTREKCWEWISRLPEHTPPTWVGLDSTAEVERERRLAGSVSNKIVTVQSKCDED